MLRRLRYFPMLLPAADTTLIYLNKIPQSTCALYSVTPPLISSNTTTPSLTFLLSNSLHLDTETIYRPPSVQLNQLEQSRSDLIRPDRVGSDVQEIR